MSDAVHVIEVQKVNDQVIMHLPDDMTEEDVKDFLLGVQGCKRIRFSWLPEKFVVLFHGTDNGVEIHLPKGVTPKDYEDFMNKVPGCKNIEHRKSPDSQPIYDSNGKPYT